MSTSGGLASFPRTVAAIGGTVFGVTGIWALVAPRSFFETIATFEPYNQHFVQDIGAFQLGIAAVLLLVVVVEPADALAVALLGAGVGGGAHVLSHLIGADLGGTPGLDIPVLSLLAGLLLAAGWMRFRQVRRPSDASMARSGRR